MNTFTFDRKIPISRRLAEMLRGTLEIESEAGEGSTFRLTLPATAEAQQVRRVVDESPVKG